MDVEAKSGEPVQQTPLSRVDSAEVSLRARAPTIGPFGGFEHHSFGQFEACGLVMFNRAV